MPNHLYLNRYTNRELQLLMEQIHDEIRDRKRMPEMATPIDDVTLAPEQGSMHTYASGAKRSERMPRYDLIVGSFTRRLAQRCTGKMKGNTPDGGALKYGEGNWEKGLPTSDVLNHIIHHLERMQDQFRKTLAAVAKMPELSWDARMEEVRLTLKKLLDEDDDIGGAAWGLMVLSHQLEHRFFHDPAFESPPQVNKDPSPQGSPEVQWYNGRGTK